MVFKSGTLAGTLLHASNRFEFGSTSDNRTQISAWMAIIVIKIIAFHSSTIVVDIHRLV